MIDELLGRLEPSTVKYGMGRGGIPELTPQDIAAALGLCEDKLAVAIYQAITVHSFSDWQNMDRMLADVQFREWQRRADRLINAQLAKAQAQIIEDEQERQVMISRAEIMLSGAKQGTWPGLVEKTYAAMRKALIAELRSSRSCQFCNGRGTVMDATVVKPCEQCLATGLTFVSDRQRAAMLRIDHSTYRRGWKKVYEWMYRTLLDASARGREQFSRAVERVYE